MPAAKDLPAVPEGQEAPPPKRKSRFKLIMVLLSLLFFILAAAGGGYYFLYMRPGATGLSGLFGSSDSPPAITEGAAAEGSAPQGSGEPGVEGRPERRPAGAAIRPVSLPSLTVNLADATGTRYLEIGMDVEVNAPEAVDEIASNNARVRDAIILLLSSKTMADLASAEGKILLKNEVAARLNQILGNQRVIRIYFTKFVIR